MSKTILFFGTDHFSGRVLSGLLAAGIDIAAVITQPDRRSGRGQKLIAPVVKTIAEQSGIRVLQPEKLRDIATDIASYEKPAAILASYGKIIPQSILDLFEPGIINVHPSLLPRYRGASPIESAILNGDDVTGVSIMQLVAEMDAGPVYDQSTIPLTGKETAEALSDQLAEEGVRLLVQALPAILDGSLQPTPQVGEPSYCSKIDKSAGTIDWHLPALRIDRQIRAYHAWPQSRAHLGAHEFIITKAAPLDDASGTPGQLSVTANQLVVATGHGCLRIDAVKPLGKKEMPIQAFLAGYRGKL